jgi:hypothetical protein
LAQGISLRLFAGSTDIGKSERLLTYRTRERMRRDILAALRTFHRGARWNRYLQAALIETPVHRQRGLCRMETECESMRLPGDMPSVLRRNEGAAQALGDTDQLLKLGNVW